MKLNASNEGPTTHTQRVQFSTVKWTEGCTREASLSFEDSRWSRKITISERIGLLNGSRKSINEADKVVATTTLRLLTYLSTLELLLIFQFNRRYFARGRVDYNTWQDNPSTIERWTSSVFNYVAFGCNHARFEYRPRIKQCRTGWIALNLEFDSTVTFSVHARNAQLDSPRDIRDIWQCERKKQQRCIGRDRLMYISYIK